MVPLHQLRLRHVSYDRCKSGHLRPRLFETLAAIYTVTFYQVPTDH